MAEITGREIELGVAVESTRLTPETEATKWVKKVKATILEKVEIKIDESTMNTQEDAQNSRVVKKWSEGELEMNIHADAIGFFLYSLFGTATPSLIETGVYSHALIVDTDEIQHPALTLFPKDGAVSQETFATCMISGFDIDIVGDDFCKFKANFIGGIPASNSDTPSYDTEYDFVGAEVEFKVAATEGGLAGASETKIKELHLSIDTGLIPNHVIGNYYPEDIYNAKFSITGSIVSDYVDEVYKDAWTAQTDMYSRITITGTTLIGATKYASITITLHKMIVTDWSRDGGNDELVTQNIAIKGLLNTADAEAMELTLQNKTATYIPA